MINLNILVKGINRAMLFLSSLFPACNQTTNDAPAVITNRMVEPKIEMGNTERFVTLEVLLDKAKDPKFIFTDLAFDKKKGFLFMKDDGIRTDYSIVFKVLSGGEIDGKQYPGFTFDDGTGKKIGYKYSFAINANEGHSTSPNATTWTEMMEMIDKGHAIMNHTIFHGGADKLKAVKDGEKNMWSHTKYRMTEMVPPGSDEGFVETGLQLGYQLMSSEFGEPMPDGNNDPDNSNMSWGAYIPTTTQNFKKVLVSRVNLGDKWDSKELMNAKAFVDYIYANKDLAKKPIGTAFSHGPFSEDKQAAENFNRLMVYIRDHTSNQGSTWITSSKELMDYMKTKNQVLIHSRDFDQKNQKFKIVFDMGSIDPNVIYRNLSLRLWGGEIMNVSVTGAKEVTFNKKTGLINIYKTDRSKVVNPFTDILPPQIESLFAKDNEILITFDKPVFQTLKEAYQISDNKVERIEGDGKEWKLILRSKATSTQFFSYRMQDGDARSQEDSSLKVCSYIRMPMKQL